jgi:hypothetical protein
MKSSFDTSLVKALPLIQYDYTPLVLSTSINFVNSHYNIKFEKIWLQQKGLVELFTLW